MAIATRTSRVPRMFISLSEPGFRAYMSGMLFVSIPMTMQQVAQGYLAYTLTGSATALGLVAAAWGIPGLIFTLFAGVVADRYDRKRILAISQGTTGLCAVVTAVLIHTGVIEIWHLVAIGFVQGSIMAFNMPARQGMLPEIVPEGLLANAVATHNSMFNLLRIAGPSIAGGIIAIPQFGVPVVYDLMAVSYFIAMFWLWRLPVSGTRQRPSPQPMAAAIGDGFRYIAQSRSLTTLLMFGLVFVLFGIPYMNMLPVFAVRVLDVGSAGLGLLTTMAGVGALVGSLFMAAISDRGRKDVIQVTAAICFGVALVVFALSQNFLVMLAMMPLVGGFSNLYISMNQTLFMLNTDREYIGRVSSIYLLNWSLMPLTTLPLAAAVDAFGAPATVATMGALVVLFIGTLAVLRLPRQSPAPV